MSRTKGSLNEATWMLGLLAGAICIVFALLSFTARVPELFENPLRGSTGMVSVAVLSIMGLLILGVARTMRSESRLTTTGGVRMLIFGFVAYLSGGGLGASLALLNGFLVLVLGYV